MSKQVVLTLTESGLQITTENISIPELKKIAELFDNLTQNEEAKLSANVKISIPAKEYVPPIVSTQSPIDEQPIDANRLLKIWENWTKEYAGAIIKYSEEVDGSYSLRYIGTLEIKPMLILYEFKICYTSHEGKYNEFQIAEVDYDICVEQYHKAKKSLDRKYKREISGNILLADWNAWCIFCALHPNKIELLDGGGIIYKGEQIYLRKALGGDWLIGIIDTDNKRNHEYPIKESDYLLALERFKEAQLRKEEYPAIQNAKEIWKLWCNSGEYKLYKFSHSPANDSYRIDAGNTWIQIIAYRGEYRLWRNLNGVGSKEEYRIDKATFDELVKLHTREEEKRSILEKSHPPESKIEHLRDFNNVSDLVGLWDEWCSEKARGLHMEYFHESTNSYKITSLAGYVKLSAARGRNKCFIALKLAGSVGKEFDISNELYLSLKAAFEKVKKSESGEKEKFYSVDSIIKLWNEWCSNISKYGTVEGHNEYTIFNGKEQIDISQSKKEYFISYGKTTEKREMLLISKSDFEGLVKSFKNAKKQKSS